MDIQEIEITINKQGQVEVHVRGVKGKTCLELTRALEEALGGEVILREMTPEADETTDNPLDHQLDLRT
ncbi:MAG TPA: DUF2997 domain-containing protein [Anaerolineaceae bacterium]|jgi:hypothetical protein|nr:DUF2997 domain-containing protein [Longilinea sp.]HPA32633.1 DUF2997 domain-containing protein [Anaerolineaceae bacterium]HQL39537.1 DUF2997 domain-containing protein [Anaerolineaceae bacterium]HQO96405.1 DUF2997 domain-containing protein [Anaerolineaceae bacterium]HQP59920.1 DUF2997 domain-containing protein [Anaerolineaceae bacterium]